MLNSFWSKPQDIIEKKVVFVIPGHGPYSTGAIVKIFHSTDFNFDAVESDVKMTIWNQLMEKYDFDMPYNTTLVKFYLRDDIHKVKVSQEAVNQTAQDAFDRLITSKSKIGCAIL